MEIGVWLDLKDKSVQDWIEYDSDGYDFVVSYCGNTRLGNDLPFGIGTLIKHYKDDARILILPKLKI